MQEHHDERSLGRLVFYSLLPRVYWLFFPCATAQPQRAARSWEPEARS